MKIVIHCHLKTTLDIVCNCVGGLVRIVVVNMNNVYIGGY